MDTAWKDVALCALIVGATGAASWSVQAWAFDEPVPARRSAPPAPSPSLDQRPLEHLPSITPPGERAPPPPGVQAAERETRAA